jgi:hypothetical protein
MDASQTYRDTHEHARRHLGKIEDILAVHANRQAGDSDNSWKATPCS